MLEMTKFNLVAYGGKWSSRVQVAFKFQPTTGKIYKKYWLKAEIFRFN